MGKSGIPGMFGAIEVADKRIFQTCSFQTRAIRLYAPAKGGHHPANMFAHHNIAQAFLPKLAIHIVNENLGQHDGGDAPICARCIQSDDGKRGQCGDHFKAAIHGVGDFAVSIPMGLARLGDDSAIKRRERIPPFIAGKKRFQQFQRHAYLPIGLLFFGSRHIGGYGPFSKGSGRVMERSSCMNRKIVPALALVALALAASGCTRIVGHQGYITDPTLADAIQPGVDNRDSVEKTLGRPTWVSQFGAQDYYYFSRNTRQYAFNTPTASEQTAMRIRFDAAGNVIAVERRGMEQIAKVDPTGKKTQTLGRERSFFQELFGNIGQVGSVGESGGTADNPN